jgi:hypothetical protein
MNRYVRPSRPADPRAGDDLGLDRDVERRDRLVAHDERWLDGQRPGDAHALPLPAGHLVRVAVGVLREQAHAREQIAHARAPARGRGDDVVHREGLGQDLPHGHAGIE